MFNVPRTTSVYEITVALSTNPTRDCTRRIEIGAPSKDTPNPLNECFGDARVHIVHVDRFSIWGYTTPLDVVRAAPSLHSFQAFSSNGWRHTITDRHIPGLVDVFDKDDAFTKTLSTLQIFEGGLFIILLPDGAPYPRGHIAYEVEDC